MDHGRTDFNHREHAFASLWQKENALRRGINHGGGILQDLMVDPNKTWLWRAIISNRDAAIVATVVQWLGSNVGMDFVRRALKRCGYEVVETEGWREADDCCTTCRGRGRKGMFQRRIVCGWCRTPWYRPRKVSPPSTTANQR